MRTGSNRVRCLAGAGLVCAALSFTAPALAQTDYVGATPPRVGNVEVGARTFVAQQVPAQVSARSGLAVTGSDIMGLTFLGAMSIGTGVILVRRARPAVR